MFHDFVVGRKSAPQGCDDARLRAPKSKGARLKPHDLIRKTRHTARVCVTCTVSYTLMYRIARGRPRRPHDSGTHVAIIIATSSCNKPGSPLRS
jgi:hypothetical protein